MNKYKEKEEYQIKLNKQIELFNSMIKTKKYTLNRYINSSIFFLKVAQLSDKNGREHFFKNISLDYQVLFDFLVFLYKNNLWEFKKKQIQWFVL